MKKTYLGLFLLGALALTSCSGSSGNDIQDMIEYYPFKLESDGSWGMLDKDGKPLFSDEFKNEPSPVVNGLFYVREGESGYTLYAAEKKPRMINDNLYSVGFMNDGVIPLSKKGERISLMNEKGEIVANLGPVKGKEIVKAYGMLLDGLIVAEDQDSKFGAFDKSGNVVIEFKYEYLTPFSEGYALGLKETGKDEDGISEYKIVVVNHKGEETGSLKKDYEPQAMTFNDGLLPVRDNDGRCGFINTKGEFTRLSSKVKYIGDYNSKYFVYQNEDNEWGVMKNDKDNEEVVIRAKYNSLSMLPDNKFLAVKDDKISLINDKDEKEVQFNDDYEAIIYANASKFKYVAREGSHYVLLDDEGKTIDNKDYDDITVNFDPGEVHSDYFNIDSFVEDLTGQITDNGIGKYYIGEPATEFNSDPYAVNSNYYFNDEDLNHEGYRYTITFDGETDRSIVDTDYDYDYYTYSYTTTKTINRNSKIERLSLQSCPDSDCWKEAKPKIIKNLEAKGYKVDDQSENDVVLSNNKVNLYVSGNSCISIHMRATGSFSGVAEEVAVEEYAEPDAWGVVEGAEDVPVEEW